MLVFLAYIFASSKLRELLTQNNSEKKIQKTSSSRNISMKAKYLGNFNYVYEHKVQQGNVSKHAGSSKANQQHTLLNQKRHVQNTKNDQPLPVNPFAAAHHSQLVNEDSSKFPVDELVPSIDFEIDARYMEILHEDGQLSSELFDKYNV